MGSKLISKRDIVRFLGVEVCCYIDSYESFTIWHCRDLCSVKKRILKSKDINVISVPNFEGLTVDTMLAYA